MLNYTQMKKNNYVQFACEFDYTGTALSYFASVGFIQMKPIIGL